MPPFSWTYSALKVRKKFYVIDVIIKAKNELAKWQELKKGLLQQMFV